VGTFRTTAAVTLERSPSRATDVGVGVGGLLVAAAVAAAAVGQGGYYRSVTELCAALLAGAAVALVGGRLLSVARHVSPVLVGLATMALAATAVASVDDHIAGAAGVVALLAGVAVIVLTVAGLGFAARRQLADMVLAVGVFLAATGWIGVTFRIQPLAHADGGLWRAATTITYANASAAVLGPLALWALARAAVRPGWSSRLLATGLVAGVGATMSRAGLAGFVLGLVVLAWLMGRRGLWRVSARPVLAGCVVIAGLLPGMPTSRPAEPLWAFLGLVVGVAIALAPPLSVGGRRLPPRWCGGRRVALVVVALIAVASGATLLAGRSGPWAQRLSLSSPDRSSVSTAALHMWEHHLLTGVGPGAAVFIWDQAGNQPVFDRYAHDEYLQLAAEQGLVGLAGLAVLLGGLGLVMRRGWRLAKQEPAEPKALVAAAIAGLAALALHSGFDFLWHVPLVVMVAAVAAGMAAPTEQPKQEEVIPAGK
jgi:hypothetical protein